MESVPGSPPYKHLLSSKSNFSSHLPSPRWTLALESATATVAITMKPYIYSYSKRSPLLSSIPSVGKCFSLHDGFHRHPLVFHRHSQRAERFDDVSVSHISGPLRRHIGHLSQYKNISKYGGSDTSSISVKLDTGNKSSCNTSLKLIVFRLMGC